MKTINKLEDKMEESEVIFNISENQVAILLEKIDTLYELKVSYHPDVEMMRQEAIETLREGITDIRRDLYHIFGYALKSDNL